MKNNQITRRDFLKLAGATSAGLVLTACGVKAVDLSEPSATPWPSPSPSSTATITPLPEPSVTNTPIPIPSEGFLLRDEYADDHQAGSLEWTVATDGQSLRRVVDPDGLMLTTGGVLRVSGSGVTADYRPGLSYAPFPRAGIGAGLVLLARVKPNAGRGPDYVGWYMNPAPTGSDMGNEYSGRFVETGLYASDGLGKSLKLGTYEYGITYNIAVILHPAGGGEFWIRGGTWTDWTQLHSSSTAYSNKPYFWPTISFYTQSTQADVDWVMVCPYVDNNFESYLVSRANPRPAARVIVLGDSKSIPGATQIYPCSLNTAELQFPVHFIANPGATTESRYASLTADIAAVPVEFIPDYILYNLGTNDAGILPARETYMTQAGAILDGMHAAFPAARIGMMQVSNSNYLANCATMSAMNATLVSTRAAWASVGPDESSALTGSVDGIHPNQSGYIITGELWRAWMESKD